MKKSLLPLLLLCAGMTVHAQHDIFALTGTPGNQINFNDFRSMDAKTLQTGEVFLNAETAASEVFSQTLNGKFSENRSSVHRAQSPMIAALAYDSSGKDLVYFPMFSSNMYVLNTRSKKITLVENTLLKSSACDIGSHITRMTLGADGNIYAMTNSGSHLYKISKVNDRYTISDLGPVKDTSAKAEVSLHQMNSGYGGDMIADANGDLLIFAASGNIFRAKLNTMTAEFVGKIKGLPEGYSVNGTAVNAEGNVMLGSAKGGSYEVNMRDLEAKPLAEAVNIPVYDLASQYLLHERKEVVETQYTGIDIYPTKATEGYVNIKITDPKLEGNLIFELFDARGQRSAIKTLTAVQRNPEQRMELGTLLPGMYVSVVKDTNGKQLFSKKILVE